MNDTNLNNSLINIEIPDSSINLLQEVYEDTAKSTVEETGKIVGRLPRLINSVLAPLDAWIMNKKYNLAETKKLLEQKLQHVDENKIVSPEAYVAIPAIQALSYSMDSDELRELYANLLAKSMVSYTKDSVHPAFVETIKQMSPIDAKIFKKLSQFDTNAMIHMRETFDSDTFKTLATNITGFDIATHELQSASIDNLEKLKLIHVPDDEFLTSDFPYERIYHSNEYSQLVNRYTFLNKKTQPVKKVIHHTSLGKMFRDICLH